MFLSWHPTILILQKFLRIVPKFRGATMKIFVLEFLEYDCFFINLWRKDSSFCLFHLTHFWMRCWKTSRSVVFLGGSCLTLMAKFKFKITKPAINYQSLDVVFGLEVLWISYSIWAQVFPSRIEWMTWSSFNFFPKWKESCCSFFLVFQHKVKFCQK